MGFDFLAVQSERRGPGGAAHERLEFLEQLGPTEMKVCRQNRGHDHPGDRCHRERDFRGQ